MHRKSDSKILKKSLRCGFNIDHANPSMVRLRGCDSHRMWSIYPAARWWNIPPLCMYPIVVVFVDSFEKFLFLKWQRLGCQRGLSDMTQETNKSEKFKLKGRKVQPSHMAVISFSVGVGISSINFLISAHFYIFYTHLGAN